MRNFSPQLGTLRARSQHLSPHCAGPWLMVRGHTVAPVPAHWMPLRASHFAVGPLWESCSWNIWPFSFFMAFKGFSL